MILTPLQSGPFSNKKTSLRVGKSQGNLQTVNGSKRPTRNQNESEQEKGNDLLKTIEKNVIHISFVCKDNFPFLQQQEVFEHFDHYKKQLK